MQQIYRRKSMPKCDFNEVVLPKRDFNEIALQLYWNHTSVRVLSCNFAAYFQSTFL